MSPVELPTVADTYALGVRLGELVAAGDLMLLTGPLGAGKTVLAQGIGAGLGVTGPVLSPTFVIARVHPGGRLPMVHVDAYRLGGIGELDDLDLDADVAASVTVVEWGEGLVERLTEEHLRVDLDRGGPGERRTARLHPHGAGWTARIATLSCR